MATPTQLAALKKVVPAAQASFRKWGVPASVTLAQWMLESSWGQSQLSLKANNCFGIKAMQLNTPSTYDEFPTAEYEGGKRVIVEALFQRFPDEAGSFDVHGRLLATATRYRFAMAYSHDPAMFVSELQKAYYSSSPTYAQTLDGLIREYDLTQYDTLPPAAAAAEKAS